MKFSDNEIIILGLAILGGIIILNTITSDTSDLIDSGSQDLTSTVTTIAPYALGAGALWALVAVLA